MSPIEIAVIVPSTESARPLPTRSRIHVEKYMDTMPIEKIVLARSYRTQLATAPVEMWRGAASAAAAGWVIMGLESTTAPGTMS